MKNQLLLAGLFTLFFSCGTKTSDENAETNGTPNQQTFDKQNKELKKIYHKDGPYNEKYPNGQVKIEGQYKNGTRHGLWKSFYEDGTKYSEDFFEDGKKNGKTATYYKNGKLRYIGYFSWDEPSGSWQFFNEDGTLKKAVDYTKTKQEKNIQP